MAEGLGQILDVAQKSAGVWGNLVGGVFSAVAAGKQAKEAKKQAEEGRRFSAQQRGEFSDLYSGLLNQQQSMPTYKGDTSMYDALIGEAKNQQIMANQVNPADALQREQSRQTSANYIEQASRGAKSGTDLMAIAGIGASGEASQMRDINASTANQMYGQRMNAGQSLLSALSQKAVATARERGLEFESILQKNQGVLGLTREAGLGGLDMAYRQQQEDLARRGAAVNAQASIWSGVGDVFRSIGTGIMQNNMANAQMDYLKSMSGNTGNAQKTTTSQ